MRAWIGFVLAVGCWVGAVAMAQSVDPAQAPLQREGPRGAVSADAGRRPAGGEGAGSQVSPLAALSSVNSEYRIGPNDLIDVEVYGLPELKRTVRVNASGGVSLALVGTVPILGMTAQQAEALIAAKYAEKYLQDPQVSVFIKEFTTQRITIEGAVQRPGIYPVTGKVTLLRVLALAGGGAQYADLEDILVFRAGGKTGSQTLRFNLQKIRKAEQPDPVIEPEDIIVVNRDSARAALRDSLFRDIVDSINPFSGLAK